MTAGKITSFFVPFLLLVAPSFSIAAGFVAIVPENCRAKAATDCGVCDFAQLAQNVINDGILFAVVVSAVIFAWAGWQYMTAGGYPYKAKKARDVFLRVLIGLALIVGAWLLVDVFLNILTGQTNLQWNRIC